MHKLRIVTNLITALVIGVVPAFAGEYHSGDQLICSDCHIMHASKNNTQYIVSESLLKHPTGQVGLCLSCHDGTDTNAPDIISTGTSAAPNNSVATAYASKYGSSAGCFQSDHLATANPFGHDIGTPGTVTAPLSSTFTRSGGLKCSDCHEPHGSAGYRNLKSDPNPSHTGSFQILLGTHVKETVAVNAVTPNPAQAYDTGNVGWYTANNITAWCSDCHDQISSNTTGGSPAHFMGHPSDIAVNLLNGHTNVTNWTSGTIDAATGFGTDIGDGTAGIPRLRFGSSTGSSGTASAGDTVTCLSCHKAHGSNNHSGLNWPFKSSTPDQYAGCQQCHYK